MSLQDFSQFVISIVHNEFQKASEFDTKRLICQRTTKLINEQVLDILNMKHVKPSNSIYIHPDIAVMIENLYKSIIMNDVKLNDLTMKFTAFKSSEYLEPSIVKNLLKEFHKNCETNKKDHILKDNSLNIILAVDGMQGVNELINYYQNVSHVDDSHMKAVREMYKRMPTMMTGTDSAHFIKKILLEIYAPFVCDNTYLTLLINKQVQNINDYLFKQSQQFKEIAIMNDEFVQSLKDLYTSYVDNLEQVAKEKLQTFDLYSKRKAAEGKRKGAAVVNDGKKRQKK